MAKQKIAILGGGVGSITAAFELTEQEGWKDKYEITIYQMGWRLGGKGASGRNLANKAEIEEHGLHVWFGFYENAFRFIRGVYAADSVLEPASVFRSWSDAFSSHNRPTLMEFVSGQWKAWPVDMPQRGGLPGDGGAAADSASPWRYVLQMLDWMTDEYDKITVETKFLSSITTPVEALLSTARNLPEPFLSAAMEALAVGNLAAGSSLHLAYRLARSLNPATESSTAPIYNFILQLLTFFLDSWIRPFPLLSDDLRRLAISFDLAGAAINGMIRSNVIGKGFDFINDHDYAEWLRANGARFTDSVLIRNLYDGLFAYRKGDPQQPNLEAGTALRGQLRMLFDYRGSVIWKMNAGMGDVVFAPCYRVLKNRGVKFEFFQRVKQVSLGSDRRSVGKITLDIQARTKAGEYAPLVMVNGLPSWPNKPLYDQLENGDTLKQYNLESWYSEWHDAIGQRTLVAGQDFDLVILGTALGSIPYICPELVESSSSWKMMVSRLETVPTQACQVWLHKTLRELGWDNGASLPSDKSQLLCGYVEPFDTSADMSHTLPREGWGGGDNVKSAAYFCNVLDDSAPVPPPFTDPDFPARQEKSVKQNVAGFFKNDLVMLWPNAGTVANPKELDPALIQRLYLRANIDPPERYVLSTVGSSAFRLDPANSGFSNLFLAGDWTRSGLNGGCVEGAVMSGLAAARAILGSAQEVHGFEPTLSAHSISAALTPPPSGSEIREYWQQQAESRLPPESQVVARNSAITALYMELYQNKRELFKWSGLASYASHRVGLLLKAYDFPGTPEHLQVLRHGTGVPIPEGLGDDINIIRQMNNAVYRDIVWALLAYQSVGLDPVLAGLKDLPDHEYMVSGFQKIDQGRKLLGQAGNEAAARNLIWDGNQDLLFHEQKIILQPGYDRMSLAFEDVLAVVASMDFNVDVLNYDPKKVTVFTLFLTVFGTMVLLQTGLLPHIANFTQRWFWVSRSILPMWRGIDGESKDHLQERAISILLREKLVSQIHLSNLWPLDKRPG